MSTMATPVDGWQDIPWRKLHRAVFKLQTRIYQARRRGDVRAVRKLQRLLVKSRSARLLATRRVTQDNRGKRTAGVDGVKLLTPPQRLKLASSLALPTKASPTRRVWIPKAGTKEQRPLGIPTMQDRAAQALLKLALEPEWEAVFEPNSYGFRPGRSAHDAIGALYKSLLQAKFVLDADIAKCFDRIDHKALLQKLNTTPTFRRAIRAWLKAGVMDGPTLFPTEEGTPQGGVISPLLANIALHGLEEAVKSSFPAEMRVNGERLQGRPQVVRYADDFVILHHDLGVVEKANQIAADWLTGMGLELKPGKTRIAHTLREHECEQPGFDFLGFTVRHLPCGKTHSAKVGGGGGYKKSVSYRGYRTSIRPSKQSVKNHEQHLRKLIQVHNAQEQSKLILALNRVVAGWSNYFRSVPSTETFAKVDHHLFLKLLRWAIRRHPNKPARWTVRKYWHPERGKWTFAANDFVLRKHAKTRIQLHIPVNGGASPFNGNWMYWTARLGKHPKVPRREALLLKRQKGRCSWCRLLFVMGDQWEVDHIVPKGPPHRGSDTYDNLQLLHQHCHDQKTARDITQSRSARDKGQTTEEPDEAKVSRPVL